MKKVLIFLFSLSFFILNLNFQSQAIGVNISKEKIGQSEYTNNDTHNQKKLTEKKIKSTKNKKLSRSYYAFKEVVNHPFKMSFRGALWGFLGSFLSTHAIPLCAVCGVVSKAMELYEIGYAKASN